LFGKWKANSRELSVSLEEDVGDVVDLMLVLFSKFIVDVIAKQEYMPCHSKSILEFSPNIHSRFTFPVIGTVTILASSHGSSEIVVIIDSSPRTISKFWHGVLIPSLHSDFDSTPDKSLRQLPSCFDSSNPCC